MSLKSLEAELEEFVRHTPGMARISGRGFIVGSIQLASDGQFNEVELDDLLLTAGPCYDQTAEGGIRFCGQVTHGARVAYFISKLALARASDGVAVQVRISNFTMALGVNLVTAQDECGQPKLHVWPWMTTDIECDS